MITQQLAMSSWAPYLSIAVINLPLAVVYGQEVYAFVCAAMLITWLVLGF